MTDAGWAERKVEKARLNYSDDEPSSFITIDQGRAMLLKEHARSVRIVLRLMKQAEKEHRFNQYNAMAEVLTALQRGRGGKG